MPCSYVMKIVDILQHWENIAREGLRKSPREKAAGRHFAAGDNRDFRSLISG